MGGGRRLNKNYRKVRMILSQILNPISLSEISALTCLSPRSVRRELSIMLNGMVLKSKTLKSGKKFYELKDDEKKEQFDIDLCNFYSNRIMETRRAQINYNNVQTASQ